MHSKFQSHSYWQSLVSTKQIVFSLKSFFPFGASAGDVALNLSDDGSSDPIPLSPSLPFLKVNKTSLRVSYLLNLIIKQPQLCALLSHHAQR